MQELHRPNRLSQRCEVTAKPLTTLNTLLPEKLVTKLAMHTVWIERAPPPPPLVVYQASHVHCHRDTTKDDHIRLLLHPSLVSPPTVCSSFTSPSFHCLLTTLTCYLLLIHLPDQIYSCSSQKIIPTVQLAGAPSSIPTGGPENQVGTELGLKKPFPALSSS